MANLALGRTQVPADLVGTVIFFASPASDFITGPDASGRRRRGYALMGICV
jgi:hypothetical protein